MLLFRFAEFIKALSTANSLSDVRDATDAFLPTAEAFLQKVASQEVVLPYQLKGEAAVMAEIAARATSVSKVLGASGEQAAPGS
jgi:hypothetical protein